ncbi:auxin response factor 18 [Coffea eugenioides]|uniref:Auxin response factor n=1 Tax=Coffea arabica TaxID=13443 RepID=A0A6P6U5Y6_COFAR|nr:auxin response factor 18-like [Coffea arabica]XP_027085940.1 auxin response factor 18-like [Coffea arabica]XP_027085948.1 auxin response factor 18-like [Coffea arabica]XP_027085957.1 auxin response factor 18-like [Coffea arabica]XP_027085965.1 auxin response factor 18-like [Coffea arabica]XP_027085973.1 auxin response factor 18-like [Coffea arabica]XP_027085983.1 auxin response factor 18-like [Coffea arabica]XP_027085989.1 auxin response factor 18-like [Coffea arabica]XP_027085998.1 auxi
MKEMVEKSLDSQLWHACAGGMVQMPVVNSRVYYFPQGHAEHTLANVDFAGMPRVQPLILCRVAAVKFLADPETDEVYARVRLVPIGNNEGCYEFDDDGGGVLGGNGPDSSADKPASFAKTLTQSDANNGGGFSVPRYCAETIFPRLDYTADPPVQTVVAKDVHGETWKFRHIYRGTPRRHLLTTGWSTFVNQKKLIAGDSIVFLRAESGDLCVGIRRAKRGGIGGPESPSGWNSAAGNYGGFSMFLREDENKLMRTGSAGNLNSPGNGGGALKGRGRVRAESVIEAASFAVKGQPFDVVYYPRASTPEFFVKASSVSSAMRVQWCAGMRFKMPFETEDSSRISWFMGTIAAVQFADPIRWPNSPWRLLQVTWDEPDLLQNVKRVSPWLVELVSNMPVIHLSPFSPARKKLRLLQHSDFSLDGQFPMPSFSGNPLGPSSPLCCLSDNIPAGIQGARHAQLGVQLADLHLSNKMHLGLISPSFQQLDPLAKSSDGIIRGHLDSSDDISCLLTMGNSSQKLEKTTSVRTPRFLLFGQPILTEQQMSHGYNSDAVSQVGKSSACGISLKAEDVSLDQKVHMDSLPNTGLFWNQGCHAAELGLDTGHCKVFLESEDVGRTLDLSVLGSYEELYKKLTSMFMIERSELEGHVFYRDATGALKQTGDESFSEFVRTAKRLTIFKNPGNSVGRKWLTGLPTAERGLDSSNQAGPLSIFA